MPEQQPWASRSTMVTSDELRPARSKTHILEYGRPAAVTMFDHG
eukprot:SAG22_NODE_3367_length_1755_cov_42.324164_1_plen_43_part_10